MKKTDLHIHTNFSFDGKGSMQDYCLKAVELNIDTICFTDHIECSPYYNSFDTFNFEKYFSEYQKVKKQFEGKLEVLIGIEFGDPQMYPDKFEKITKMPFDIILGSAHYSLDRYYSLNNMSVFDMYDFHYNETLELVKFGQFDCLTHLDFPKKFVGLCQHDFSQIINDILTIIIKKDIPLELNTSPLRRGLSEISPSNEILKTYFDLGGKKVLVNSDAHLIEHLYSDIENTINTLHKNAVLGMYKNRKFIEIKK